MGLETSTYISGLTSTWPVSSDPKSQGDDHLRLLKGVLQSTFPNASAPFYFPQAVANATGTLAATTQNSMVFYDTSAGNLAVQLPTLAVGNAGWWIDMMKFTTDTNAITVSPPSGSIVSAFGAVATVRVGAVNSIARFIWNGSSWFVVKGGPMIGSTINFDGPSTPAGYLTLDGSTFSGTTFAELAAALGGTTLRDKRGRTDIGAGTGAGLTPRVAGTPYGAETVALATGNLPPYTPAGSIANGAISVNVTTSPTGNGSMVRLAAGAGGLYSAGSSGVGDVTISATASQGGSTFSGSAQGGASTPFGLLQPSIGTQKLIRAC